VPEPIRRTTARVVPVSPEGACLLLLERDPTPAQAALDGRLVWHDLADVLGSAVATVKGTR
jgi:hypothetical protein